MDQLGALLASSDCYLYTMQLRFANYALMVLCLFPAMCSAQTSATRLLATADTLFHQMQYEVAAAIADSLLTTNLSKSNRGSALLLKARTQERAGDLKTATATTFEALVLAEELGLDSVTAGAYSTLALIYEEIADHDQCRGRSGCNRRGQARQGHTQWRLAAAVSIG